MIEEYPSCCNWDHVRPCGPVPGNVMPDGERYEPICACGCSGYDERCGGGEWWLNPYDAAEGTVPEATWGALSREKHGPT
jgi:hypothetical protein